MLHITRAAGLLVACAVAFAGMVGGSAHAQIFLPQPYLVYEVPPAPLQTPTVVDLEDQFIRVQDRPVLDRWFHMNPVDKLPIEPQGDAELRTDLSLHYRWLIIDVQGQGTRIVQVTNQFASQEDWEIARWPEFLLAPASKVIGPGDPEPPPPGQHYTCYDVVNAPPHLASVDLNDQFGPHGPTDVMEARYLCVPVEKRTEGGDVYPIFEAADGRDHLACYDVPPDPWNEQISTRDQFTGPSPDEGITNFEVMLCVPSFKDYDKVPSLAPWGIAALGVLMLLTVFAVAQRRVRSA